MEHTPSEIQNYVDNNWYKLSLMMDIDNEQDEYDIKKELVEYFTKYPNQISKISPYRITGPKNYLVTTNNIGGTYNKYL